MAVPKSSKQRTLALQSREKCCFPPPHPDSSLCHLSLCGRRLGWWQRLWAVLPAGRASRRPSAGGGVPGCGLPLARSRLAACCLPLTYWAGAGGFDMWRTSRETLAVEECTSWADGNPLPTPPPLWLVLALEYPCQKALAGSSLCQLFLLCEQDKSNVLPALDYTAVCCCLGPP